MLSHIADIADLVAATAVVASLVFVALEIRQSNRQSRLANWRDVLAGLNTFKAATNDLAFADMVARGHADYAGLAPHERLSFGLYLEQGIHMYGNFNKHAEMIPPGYDGLSDAIENSLSELLTTPGARAWWAEARVKRRMMDATTARVDRILAAASKAERF
ncbi:MAG: hypothetical protein HKO95_12220 [Rhodobacteraceae bacterium]|nr:hypothetical protein [Paracoccaceae bacterium]